MKNLLLNVVAFNAMVWTLTADFLYFFFPIFASLF